MTAAPSATTTGASRIRRLLRGVMAMVLFTIPVLLLAFAARQKNDALIHFDQDVVDAATDATRAVGGGPALIALQQASQPIVIYILATAVTLWVGLARGLRSRAVWAFVTMMVAWNIGLDAKILVQRARPAIEDPVSHAPGYSFPSGHALNMTVVASVMVFLLWPLLSKTGRRVAIAIAVTLSVAVGLDRIFLGVHFPSDVVAGWILGLGITFSSWLGFIGKTPATSLPGPSRPA